MGAEPRDGSAAAEVHICRDTLSAERVIVLACHNQTAVNRLLEVQDLFRGDFRIRFVYALGDSSRFSAGVERLLREAGIDRLLAWSDLKHVRYHLVLTASENIDFRSTAGTVLLLPHGLGFNKFRDGGTRLAGVPSPEVLRTGQVRVLLSHPEQDTQLRGACPEIAGHTLVTGDPTFDRLVASVPLRERYRRLLGVGEHRLIVLASTWGLESAVGRHHTLPHRLLADLPYDTHRVCLVAHPNIWDRHDARQLAILLADALDAGMLLNPPEAGWHAALIAADQVIADHGSLALYAAGLGKPLLLTEPAAETVSGTPMDALSRAATHLDTAGDLRIQLDAAMSDTDRFGSITDRVFAHVGHATQRLRDIVYQVLDLAPPAHPAALRRAPDPQPRFHRPASAFRVHADLTASDALTLERYPATVQHKDDDAPLVVEEAESNLRLVEKASVLCRNYPSGEASAVNWALSALTHYPGAYLAAAAVLTSGCVAVTRDGRRVRVTATDRRVDVPMLASAVYHRARAGRLTSEELVVTVGSRRVSVQLAVTEPPTGR